ASQDRDARRERLEQAVTDFDTASISTIHGFATQVRRTLGLTPAIDPDARLVASPDELVRTACVDALAAASVRPLPAEGFPKPSALRNAVKKKLGGPDLVLLPDGSDPAVDQRFLLVRELVEDALARLGSRRLGEGTIGFDDVLVQLRDALASSDAAAVVAALQARYKVVLIDEFQDTDRVQWEIFSTLFGHPGSGSTLVLVGDPKQAIYRFRGADIAVYLQAVHGDGVRERSTLPTNWRADGACLDALHALLVGSSFGDPSVHYVPVRPSDANRDRRMRDARDVSQSGLDVRLAIGPGLPMTDGKVDNDEVVRMIERDLAGHVRELLEGSRIPTSPRDPTLRRLEPSDVAVLVTGWGQAHDLQAALRDEGIPAVVAGSGSVLASPAAGQVRCLLDAMERPGDPRRVRMFALSWFVGRTVEQVAEAGDADLSSLQDRLMAWSDRLAFHPVAEVLGQIWRESGVVARVLRRPDGDRDVTDLDHLAELLHLGAPQGRSGVAGLLAILESPPDAEGDGDVDTDVTARRIESEAAAVQITTVWRAKGLEFPVVCLPMMWRKPANRTSLVYTDPTTGDRMLDVTGNGEWPTRAGLKKRQEIATTEEAAERLRILYVALTRARHLTAVWWARTNVSKSNALTRLLFARDASGVLVPSDQDPPRPRDCAMVIPSDEDIADALAPLVAVSEGAFRVTPVRVRPYPSTPWSDPSAEEAPAELGLCRLDRPLDRSVARWSFTSITRHAEDHQPDPYDTSVSDGGADDEAVDEGAEGAGSPADPGTDERGESSPDPAFARLGAGTAFGTFVHGVLESVDFAAPDLDNVLRDAIHEWSSRRGLDVGTLAPEGVDGTALLVRGLRCAIDTPLGPLFGGKPLAALDRSHRIDELGFDLRLGGSGTRPTVADIGSVAAAHLGADHPLAPWADSLANGSIDVELGGYLTGSIDLVAKVRDPDGCDRFVVADYKTNRLARAGARQYADDYDPSGLVDAMVEHHYPLQALLYGVALHRYLRWKLRGHEGTTHVAGAAYLFVRGMTGPDVAVTDGQPHGVFTWEFAPGLLESLSRLLAGEPVPGGAS
ncbi:MAG TPA: UvrD-helicase domain-containing protein, partial [Acidimicrobiales bacterium]|nr:UvrD-helicase domain-containing protein [Acidimicrobiales bacterium]